MTRALLAAVLLAISSTAAAEAGFAPAPPELMLGTAREVPPEVVHVERTWRWTTGDYVREAAVLALIAADWHQTLTFRAQGHREGNPILGPYPSRARVNVLIGGAMLLHLGVAAALPHGEWRTTWQASVGGAELLAVYSNWRNGWSPAF